MAQSIPGSIVSYVLPDGPARGQRRPAVVVKHWEGAGHADLWLFPRPSTDGPNYQEPRFLSGAANDAAGRQGTWS